MSVSRVLLLIFLLLMATSAVRLMLPHTDAVGARKQITWVSGGNPAREAQRAAFNEENPGLFLTLDMNNMGTQKIVLQSASGVGPDVFDVNDGEQLQTYVEAGIVWDITDQAKELGFSATGDLWPSARDEVLVEGRQYSYPCNIGANILIYNKNVFDYFKVPYPQGILTWDEFVALARRVNSISGKESVYAITGLSWLPIFESEGGEFFSEDGHLRIANSPELKRAFEMHRDFVFKDRIMPSTLELRSMNGQGGWGSGGLNQFAAGRFAMMLTGEWAVIGLARTYDQQVRDLASQGISTEDIGDPLKRPLKLGCVLIPKFPDHAPCYRVRSRSAAINARSPRREETLAFLRYLAGPSYSKLVNREADSLPGNPRYSELGVETGKPALARLELHETTKQALEDGYCPRRSPFLSTADVLVALRKQISRLESNPSIPTDDLLKAADSELEKLIQRNLSRDPELKKLYEAKSSLVKTSGTEGEGRP